MINPPPYTITNDSISIIWEGEPHVVRRNSPNFWGLRDAIAKEDWDSIPKHLSVGISIETWAKGAFTVDGENIYYNGDLIPTDLNRRIIEMAREGKDPTPLFNFWERLQRNPSFRSVNQLWSFLKHSGIPLTDDGCFLAYKGVRSNYRDKHTGSIDNSPGTVHEMPRNKISDDPSVPCHVGFHVGALNYASNFGDRTIICKIDPEHVVCVPYDSSQEKMRVCRYEVIGNHGSELPSTYFHDEDYDYRDEDDHYRELEEYEEEDYIDDYGEDFEDEEDYSNVVSLPKATAIRTSKKKEKSSTTAQGSRKPQPGWDDFHKMDMKQLMEQPNSVLRKYAANGLLIVGASKIPGGKTALVAKILEVRDGN